MLRRGSSELYSTPRFVYPRQAACSNSCRSASPMLRSICSTASGSPPVRASAPPPGEGLAVGEPAGRGGFVRTATERLGERLQGAFVVTDRVVVGVDGSRPVAGRQ